MPFTGKATYTAGAHAAGDRRRRQRTWSRSTRRTKRRCSMRWAIRARGRAVDRARVARGRAAAQHRHDQRRHAHQPADRHARSSSTTRSRFRVGDQIRVERHGGGDARHGGRHRRRTRSPSCAATAARRPRRSANDRSSTSSATPRSKATTPPAARFTARSRKTNYTQIFSATVEVSGSELAVRQIGVARRAGLPEAAARCASCCATWRTA